MRVAPVRKWRVLPGKMNEPKVRGADELRPLGSHITGKPGGSPLFRGVSHWKLMIRIGA